MSQEIEQIEVYGAREHNLKNIDVNIPRNKLVVITGVSGSGKSSLAFDTIYAEGQRRYMESFSAYARSFIGDMERPEVDKIEGLSPVISIEQKTTSKNPRSTVGTTTEIYDFLRLLFARAGEAYSYNTGEKMIRQSEDQIIELILTEYAGEKLSILSPIVKGRKGHYRELFVQIRKMGFSKVRIDGAIQEIELKMQLDRYKTHDIDIVIDRLQVNKDDRQRIAESVKTAMKHGKGIISIVKEGDDPRHFSKYLMCPTTGIAYDEPAPNNFSFNSPYGACPTCNGLGTIEEFTKASIIPDDKLSISQGGIGPIGDYRNVFIFNEIEKILKNFEQTLSTPINEIKEEALNIIFDGGEYQYLVKSAAGTRVPYFNEFEGLFSFLQRHKEGEDKTSKLIREHMNTRECTSCKGHRLRIESLHFKIAEENISQIAEKDITELQVWSGQVMAQLNERQAVIAEEIIKEITKRVGFLVDVGLTYLTLNRPIRTLSGGEAQRIRLATQIGTQLVGVSYIMDEPSIGLHQRDNVKLIKALKDLRDIGNTVIVVEHDRDMMLASDHVIDVGPGAGRHGGKIVAQGSPEELQKQGSTTADYLLGKQRIEIPKERRKGNGLTLSLKGATGHNLKNVDLELPLGKMICITGVSGSGKSSLIHGTLHPILSKYFFRSKTTPLPYESIDGLKHIDKVIEVDQSPIGRTPRSNAATYTGVFSDIRTLFTQLPESKIRGYKPGRFSFNVKGGRCENCEGGGLKIIEMDFLPNVHVPCEVCKGKRYNRETLEVRFKGKSIADILEMTVDQGVEFFEKQPKILRRIQTLQDVGLGYITIGQHATTLSGGEAQRVKLATELSKKDTGQTFYILDEPTTGLHFKDIQHLLNVLNILSEKGNTVLVIEHNLDVIKVADHVIDMGPEGGNGGGTIIAQGTPEKVAEFKGGFTSKFLKEELERG